jgi:hypothetical protein
MAPKQSMTGSKTGKALAAIDNIPKKSLRKALQMEVTQKLSEVANRSKKRDGKSRLSNGMGPFAGVTAVSAAPVTIGNTVRSTKLAVQRDAQSVSVQGRDFVQIVGGTATTFNNWTLQAGMPVTPLALSTSSLRGYFQSHEQFRVRRVVIHYITSSPTSLSGDILIFYHANHGGPKVDHTSNNFLSYALSTESAVLGPQWTNHSVELAVAGKWCNTDVLNAEDVQHQADGEVLVYTKNTTNGVSADSPGYVVIDYDVNFKNMMTNPRLLTIPSSIFKWFPTAAFFNAAAVGAGDPVRFDVNTTSDYALTGGKIPPTTPVGTIFQIVLDFQNAIYGIFTPASLATMFAINQARNAAGAVTGSMVYAIGTGSTLYAVYRGTTLLDLYPSYPAVFAGNTINWTAGGGAGMFINCAAIIAAVGSINSAYLQASIG